MRKFEFTIPAFVVALCFIGIYCRAAEFRVDSKVFEGDGVRPVSESLTLFHDGKIYDSLSSPPEITIFDLSQQTVVLLDPVRKLRTEIKTQQLTDFAEELRKRVTQQSESKRLDPLLRFCAEPNFTETNFKNGWLSYSSPLMTYRVRGTRAINPADAQAYREFADWTARLQSRVKLGAPPPFPRLYVNGDLERRGLRPDEVELTFKTAKTKSSVLRSTHKYESKLYSDDLKQIADADGYASSFQAVSTEEYLLPPPRQARR